MNEHNRFTSVNNTNKVEYAYNHPIASSDLNEVQSIFTSKLSSLNGLNNTGLQLKWSKVDNQTIRISDLFINSLYSSNISSNFQTSVTDVAIDIKSLTVSSTNKYTLSIYYRLREVNSTSKIYKNGIRSSGLETSSIKTVSPADQDTPNNIFDSELNEEVSTRVIVELTFVLNPIDKIVTVPTNVTDGAWTKLNVKTSLDTNSMDLNVDLNQNAGFLGYKDITGPKLFDYCAMSDQSLIPTNSIPYDQYALILSTKTVLKKSANSRVWSAISLTPSLFNVGSFIRISEFLDGTSIYDENCIGQAGYIIFDDTLNYRILLDYGSDTGSDVLIYPEYIVTKNQDGTESVELVNHPIIGPTFFSEDPVSGAIYDDPDGKLLLCTTIDNEIYFRNIFETT